MSDFSQKWKLLPEGKNKEREPFVPVILPCYIYTVPQGSKNFESYCRTILLTEKPGCYHQNVGQGFNSCQEELEEFISNSEFCPQLIKDDYLECIEAAITAMQAGGEARDLNVVTCPRRPFD